MADGVKVFRDTNKILRGQGTFRRCLPFTVHLEWGFSSVKTLPGTVPSAFKVTPHVPVSFV